MTDNKSRLGFHYYPDTGHYRERDLQTWLPELQELGAGWLTLLAPHDRAIPEPFLNGLVQAGIEPVLHLRLPLAGDGSLGPEVDPRTLHMLFQAYAGWGVHYLALFDRPNHRSGWPATSWAQSDLVERFLDLYLPLAELTLAAGLTPVFPPLEPGGDYWDTAFLRAALQGIRRRGHSDLLHALVYSAYAWADEHPLSWGAGGPERWPGARPYFTPPGQQDQTGFYIFDWYQAILQAELQESRPLLLLGAGSRLKSQAAGTVAPACASTAVPPPALQDHARRNLALARLALGEAVLAGRGQTFEPLDAHVLCCNFWLLAAASPSRLCDQAWFQPEERTLPIIGVLKQWVMSRRQSTASQPQTSPIEPGAAAAAAAFTPENPFASAHPIAHYILLPPGQDGTRSLEQIKPFIEQNRSTIGSSIQEAVLAQRVSLLGPPEAFAPELLEVLYAAGCKVDQVALL